MNAMPARQLDTPVHPAVLAAMDHETFSTLVSKSLNRHANPALWDALTDEPVISRTKDCLGALRLDLQDQLTQANAELDQVRANCMALGDDGKEQYLAAKAAQAEWRSRLIGFKRMVDQRIAFVRSRNPAAVPQKHAPFGAGFTKVSRKHNRQALEKLARAVAEHRRRVLSGKGDEDDDETLWACLSSVTAITADGDELPLREWLEYLDDVRDDGEEETQ